MSQTLSEIFNMIPTPIKFMVSGVLVWAGISLVLGFMDMLFDKEDF